MKEELLKKIRKEVKKQLSKNEKRARKNKDNFAKELSEDEVIMNVYRKYFFDIEEKDTNDLYYCEGSYQVSNPRYLQQSERATFKKYQNIEGFHTHNVPIDKASQFEKKHTVLTSLEDTSPTTIIKDFVTTAVKENQESAIQFVKKKYEIKK